MLHMKNILVAVEFEKKTTRLLKYASELAEKFKSKIWIVHIAAPDPDFVGNRVGRQYMKQFRTEHLRKEHRTIQAYANNLSKKGLFATGLLIQGSTVQTLRDEIKKLKIDLIIIGNHKHNILYRTFNEVTTTAFQKIKVPMLVLPLD
jgi:nucleotide-binding universal stress UspA family protein